MFARLGRLTVQRTMSTQAQRVTGGPVEEAIRTKLTTLLSPTSLNIQNDSWKHRHHAPMKAIGGGDGETHFNVQVVSTEFEGKSTMARHRMIYAALAEEMEAGLHALSLSTKTPKEMEKLAQAGAQPALAWGTH
ncbi:bola-domain-containing protein [Dacryopinax primogenitus]|uniref:Bola-domain-containing protein n=1 Tax=Dacryopinax primogenitus (strain DJM 731) TaxID=1858805 RepID=M5G2U7_DACPD|nr:bola-domain-containing protein [Dacryopinax primogenitus]EJU04551.1 bola-domain-containing protein [Dacryopinax primogenitus]